MHLPNQRRQTLKIIRVKNFCVVKFSRFRLIRKIFLTVDGCNICNLYFACQIFAVGLDREIILTVKFSRSTVFDLMYLTNGSTMDYKYLTSARWIAYEYLIR